MKQTALAHLVGIGLALSAGAAKAQGAPAGTPGASAPVPGTSAPVPGQPSGPAAPGPATPLVDVPARAPEVGEQGTAPGPTSPGTRLPGVPAGAEAPLPQDKPLTLAVLVAKARQQDARVEEAEAELRRLEALQRQAHWAWFPKFETVVGFGGPVPEAHNDGLGGPPTTEATLEGDLNFGTLGMTFRAEVNALLPLYTFGKLSALEKAGDQGPIIGRALRERARAEAGLQAAQAFYGYQLARSGLAQLGETEKRLDDAAKRIEALLEEESEQVSKLDTYKVNFFRQIVVARRTEAVQGQALALEAIRLLAGGKPGEPLKIAEVDLPMKEAFTPPSLEEAIAQAEQRRPELVAIQAGVTAREQEVFIRERSFYPDLGLVGFAKFAYTTNTTVQRSPFSYDPYNDRTAGVGFAMRGTFDIPVKKAQLDQARAELDKLKAQQRLLQAALRLEVTKTHGELTAALKRAQAATEAEKNARRWATAAYAAFDLGTGDTRELVDAFTALAQGSADKAKSWFDVRLGIAALERVTAAPPAEGE
ncbi:Outer membrane protein TolC [Stigmatella aurantiaca]|uniref:Outer membrane protein TolC n=1 Tax=Stigmatella aurantiaca TaxID=41 RepID=A0A1H7K1W8_STIAU|nr:TolC family protein [Stigmatella aurantiaca]SEK80410.1 Outer membrane protein TolC [Stigmatella aurantiaca]